MVTLVEVYFPTMQFGQFHFGYTLCPNNENKSEVVFVGSLAESTSGGWKDKRNRQASPSVG